MSLGGHKTEEPLATKGVIEEDEGKRESYCKIMNIGEQIKSLHS